MVSHGPTEVPTTPTLGTINSLSVQILSQKPGNAMLAIYRGINDKNGKSLHAERHLLVMLYEVFFLLYS